jgi:hypothetical protein
MSTKPNFTEYIDGEIRVRETLSNGATLNYNASGFRCYAENQGFFSGSDSVEVEIFGAPFRPPTAYAAQVNVSSSGHCSVLCRKVGGLDAVQYTGNVARTIFGYPALPPVDDIMPPESSALVKRTELKAFAKLKDQKVNLSVAFGERKEASKMMLQTISDITRQVLKFKKTFFRDLAKAVKRQYKRARDVPLDEFMKASKHASNRWLELQYGWNPLMSDVNGAMEALDRAHAPGSYRFNVVSTGHETLDWESPWQSGLGPQGAFQRSCKAQIRQKCKVRWDFSYDDQSIVRTYSSLGVTNPLELVWELVPFSFVVDWFVPIGDWLHALDATLGLKMRGGTVTMVGDFKNQDYRVRPTPGYPLLWTITGKIPWRREAFYMFRKTYGDFPFPRLPGFKFEMEGTRWLNALALARQVIK